jgi:DNA-binding CsgD family transcriptional regulator/PAS domain-containing protein
MFSHTVALIYGARIDGARTPDARRAIQRLFNADALIVFWGNEKEQTVTDAAGLPATPAAASAATGPRSRGAMQSLWLDVTDHEAEPVRLLLQRNPDREPFTDEDVELLSLLRPHLRTAYYLKAMTQDDAFGCLASAHLVRSMVKGLMITDADGLIRWSNPAARDILATGDGLSIAEGRMRAGRSFENARMELLIREAAKGKPGVMLVCRADERHPYGMEFTPLKADPAMPLPGARPATGRYVLVTIKEMQRQIRIIAERFGALFGLSPAEERLGALLLDGYTLQDAAQLANKALPTVKTQLRSMLKKTGARSQAELLNVFLSLPSLL